MASDADSRSAGRPRPGRRAFLQRAALAAGAAVSAGSAPLAIAPTQSDPAHEGHAAAALQFVCPNEPLRRRKSFYDLTDAEVRTLCRAIGYMRAGLSDHPLSVDSPIQWDQWAITHARHCTEAGPGGLGQVHWSWYFLPWHRAYLWYLERHLANIVTTVLGEDGNAFALPYWDWIAHKEMPNSRERALRGLASPLFGYDLTREDMVADDGLGFDNQALWDGYRKPSRQQPTMDPANEVSADSKEHVAETIQFMSQASIDAFLQLDFEDFAGKAIEPASSIVGRDGMGALEHYPHNNGHDWVGSRFGKNRDMGTLRYAAIDPIFFMHHANIDRIWSLYTRTQPDPDRPWGPNGFEWGRQTFVFVDIDGSEVSVSISDVIRCMINTTYVAPSAAVFTDDRLFPDATGIKAIHVLELREHIDALRMPLGLPAFAWTDPALGTGTPLLAVHVAELRSALQQAYAKAGQPAPVYTDSAIVAGTPIRAEQIQEIRDRTTALSPSFSAGVRTQTPTQPAAATFALAETVETLDTNPLVIGGTLPAGVGALLSAAGGARPLSLLVVETGPITYPEKFIVRVFVDKSDADRQTSQQDPHYVGRIQALDSASRAAEAGKDITHTFSIVILPANSSFYDLVTPGSALTLTFVPVGPAAADPGFRIPLKAISLKVY